MSGRREILLRGARFADARLFSDTVKSAWIDFNLQANRTLQQGERHPLEPTQMPDTPAIDHSGGMTKYMA